MNALELKDLYFGSFSFQRTMFYSVCCSVADFILGTVHKAKGLEFDTVMVTDDFAKVPSSKHNLHFSPDFSFGMLLWTQFSILFLHIFYKEDSLRNCICFRQLIISCSSLFVC